jgi:hypothetical protein
MVCLVVHITVNCVDWFCEPVQLTVEGLTIAKGLDMLGPSQRKSRDDRTNDDKEHPAEEQDRSEGHRAVNRLARSTDTARTEAPRCGGHSCSNYQ